MFAWIAGRISAWICGRGRLAFDERWSGRLLRYRNWFDHGCGRTCKRRYICAARKLDPHRVAGSSSVIVPLQTGTEPARIYADDGVEPRVEVFTPIEHFDALRIFLQIAQRAVQSPGHQMP
jgi:hypothetical protein